MRPQAPQGQGGGAQGGQDVPRRTDEGRLPEVRRGVSPRARRRDGHRGGRQGGKALPALLFTPFNFMPAFPVDAKTSECVPGVFAAIVATLRGLCPETASRRAEPTSRTAREAVLGQLNAHSEQLNATMCRQGTVLVAFTLTSHQKMFVGTRLDGAKRQAQR